MIKTLSIRIEVTGMTEIELEPHLDKVRQYALKKLRPILKEEGDEVATTSTLFEP